MTATEGSRTRSSAQPAGSLRARPHRVVAAVAVTAAALTVSTLLIAAAEGPALGIPDASPIYLLAVVAVAALFGSWAGAAAAVAAFLLYDVLFVHPRFQLDVADPGEWLNLLLLLFVGVAIGRLTAIQGERAEEAARRARESQALFRISRTLATATTVGEALEAIVADLVSGTGMERVWVTRVTERGERVAADSAPGARPAPTSHAVLVRTAGDEPARWIRAHVDQRDARVKSATTSEPADPTRAMAAFRVAIEADDRVVGSLWALRAREQGLPVREETRLLALAADQIGLAYHREELTVQANATEIARRSDALKTALVDSVSHDLRTPLASIRAAAGSLLDEEMVWTDADRTAAARSIDAEAQRLDRLVGNLLDLSRLEGGAMSPRLELFDLEELVATVIDRKQVTGHPVTFVVEGELPPVRVDEVYLDVVLTNILENAARHAPDAVVRIMARTPRPGTVELRFDDGGPGVPVEDVPHLFEKFYRVHRPGEGSRRSLGIGLTVVRGLVEAMGGRVRAGPSELGGLSVEIMLQAGALPPAEFPTGAPS